MKTTPINLDRVFGTWRCKACDKETQHSYTDMVEVGDPVCECGDDMELICFNGKLIE